MAEAFSHLQGHIPAFRMKWASPRGSLKKQATFLHCHCYNPGDSCHQRWGCGFKGSSALLLQPVTHHFGAGLSFPATGGNSRAPTAAVETGPTGYLMDCAGSCIKHEAILQAWLASCFSLSSCPFCRPWAQAYSSSCRFPLTSHPTVQDQVSPPARRRSVLSCHRSTSIRLYN